MARSKEAVEGVSRVLSALEDLAADGDVWAQGELETMCSDLEILGAHHAEKLERIRPLKASA